MTWDIETDVDGTVQVRNIQPPPPTNRRGGTVSLEIGFDDSSDYETLQSYIEFAGTAATGIALDGTPWYRELHGGNGLAMGVSPTDSIATVPGFWGVLVGAEEASPVPPAYLVLELEFFYLAEIGDHADLAEVESAYEQ